MARAKIQKTSARSGGSVARAAGAAKPIASALAQAIRSRPKSEEAVKKASARRSVALKRLADR